MCNGRGLVMRIGVDARSVLTKSPRGEGKSLLRLYEEIAQLRPGWDVIFFGEHASTVVLPEGIRSKVFTLPGFKYNTWENVGLPFFSWLNKCDILHCASSTAPRFSFIPIVLTVHDIIPLVFNDGWRDEAIKRFEKQLIAGLGASKKVIAVSENTKIDVINRFRIDGNKIRVVYWGCDGDHADNKREIPKIEIEGEYILAFGGDAKRKNTEALLRTFSKLCAKEIDHKLVVVGIGSSEVKERFAIFAKELGIEERVHLLPYITDEELDAVYKGATLLVYLSLYEGFGLPILEAMTRGVPVVASNCSSIPEVTGSAAYLVDPLDVDQAAEVIQKLLCDKQRLSTLSNEGRKRAGEFGWKKTAAGVIEVIEGAIRK